MKDYKELLKSVTAQYLAVYSVNDGKFIMNRDGDIECYPASVTKVLNALLAFKYLKLDDKLVVGEEQDIMHYSPDPSVAGIKKGEVWTFREMLYASLLPSGNDAAYAIGYNVVNRMEEYQDKTPEEKCHIYAKMMNDYAKELGCTLTDFSTLDGNDYVKGRIVRHVTSSQDLCLIFKEALSCPLLMEVMGTPEIRIMVGETEYHFKNTNRLIRKDSEFYNPYCLGGKTGTTNLAGYCLTTIGKKNDDIYIVSVGYCESSNDRYRDANKIFDYLFNEE
ncbi:MAG: D-alanyl-D-alanine carboxypeptidase [Bacilli bacterium]|nr:D-alanyl-D-alanine carboxypeptidase [Bacilli bacterium]